MSDDQGEAVILSREDADVIERALNRAAYVAHAEGFEHDEAETVVALARLRAARERT